MIKEAIEKIQAMSAPIIHAFEDRTFCITSAGVVTEIRPSLDFPNVLPLTSLDALVKMIQTEATKLFSPPFYVTIPDHMSVDCFAQPAEDQRGMRLTFYKVKATDVPGWESKTQLPFEEAMIALRTRFQKTFDTDYALKLLSEITTGAKITYNDNGVATTVVTKKGIDLQSNEAIRPIVSLKPYRTFQEVEQPASEFLIRINERGISFIEADGGMWKLKARETIKAYFEDKLAAEIENGAVVVAL